MRSGWLAAKKKPKGQRYERHIEELAASAHSAREPCGLPHTIAPRALKNNGGIGQRKQTDANAEQALGQNQHVHAPRLRPWA